MCLSFHRAPSQQLWPGVKKWMMHKWFKHPGNTSEANSSLSYFLNVRFLHPRYRMSLKHQLYLGFAITSQTGKQKIPTFGSTILGVNCELPLRFTNQMFKVLIHAGKVPLLNQPPIISCHHYPYNGASKRECPKETVSLNLFFHTHKHVCIYMYIYI